MIKLALGRFRLCDVHVIQRVRRGADGHATVKNMYCAACPHTVKASLQALPGVKQAVVSYKEKNRDRDL